MAGNLRNIVFISYRRDDAKHQAGRLCTELRAAVGDLAEIFLDVGSAEPGMDFRAQIDKAIERSRVMIVVIGENWLSASKEGGWWSKVLPWSKPQRRLDDPKDYVRNEIRAGLEKRPLIMVIPALMDRARMPVGSELPEDIREISYQHAVQLRHEQFEVTNLVKAVLKALADPEPETQPAVLPQHSGAAPTKAEPAGGLAAVPTPQESPQAPPPITVPQPIRQPAPVKTLGTRAAERRKVLANLEHLHQAAATRAPDIRKIAYLQYITTLDADYAKDMGYDTFAAICRSAATELDAWRLDNVIVSRSGYVVPVVLGSYALALWLFIHFDLFHGIAGLLVKTIDAILGGFVPEPLLNFLHIFQYPATGWIALWAVVIGGFIVFLSLSSLFQVLAEKWRIPQCDAALARVRSSLDSPAAAALA